MNKDLKMLEKLDQHRDLVSLNRDVLALNRDVIEIKNNLYNINTKLDKILEEVRSEGLSQIKRRYRGVKFPAPEYPSFDKSKEDNEVKNEKLKKLNEIIKSTREKEVSKEEKWRPFNERLYLDSELAPMQQHQKIINEKTTSFGKVLGSKPTDVFFLSKTSFLNSY